MRREAYPREDSMWNLGTFLALVFITSTFFVTNAEAKGFVVSSDGPVTAYWAGSSADYTNRIYSVFSDTGYSGEFFDSKVSTIGQFADLGSHVKGSEVIFSNIVVDTVETWHSTASSNPDFFEHMFHSSFTLPDGTKAMMIGFEDIKLGGDMDFNDSMFIVTNVSPVPEPSTYLMMLIGLLMLVYVSRKRGIGGSGSLAV